MILSLETATTAASVALVSGEHVLAEASVPQTRRHTEVLMGLIDEVLDQAGVHLLDLHAIACDIGPGLFTGLRVGVATAQGLALAGDLPVIPVTSLLTLSSAVGGERAALVDARRGEVFVQLFTGEAASPRALTDPLVVAPQLLASLIGPEVTVVGNGGQAATEILLASKRRVLPDHAIPMASALGLLAAQVDSAEWLSASQLRPLYLRDADAKVNFVQREDLSSP